MLNSLFSNVGGKIKSLVKKMFVIEAISSIILGVYSAIAEDFAYILIAICGPIVAWIISIFVYAYGELVESASTIRNKECPPPEDTVQQKAAENTKRKAEEKAKREAEEKAKREAEEKARREAREKAKLVNSKKSNEKFAPMEKPADFSPNSAWKNSIENLSTDAILARYNNKYEWSDSYRYLCYLELKKRLG